MPRSHRDQARGYRLDTAAYTALDAEIRSVMPSGKLIVPDVVQGRYPTLRDAVLADTREARANDTARAIPRWRMARSISRPTISSPIRGCPAVTTSRSPGGLIARCNHFRPPGAAAISSRV
ncbi:Ca2+-dependent phosphoinositide-specific phospholipase C [Sphingomonas sp. ZB1N12]|uniref:Ca2+-dependent phosphoinositide-specific phospholipase C n=1 Tax=Sphingomonas arabinosi TaxID=3096160 RepID=UPI002FCB2FE1